MSNKRVSEQRGNQLLDLVFDVVITQLKDQAAVEDIETGESVLQYTATPALLTVATKLLKDNNITVQPDNEESRMSELEKELASRKKRSQISKVSFIRPEAIND